MVQQHLKTLDIIEINEASDDIHLIILVTIDEIITTTEQEEKEDADIDKIEEDVMDSLLMLVCRSPSPAAGGDAPNDGSVAIIIENGSLCDGAEIVVNITSVTKGAEVTFLINTFCPTTN